jgi:hypothetical protein
MSVDAAGPRTPHERTEVPEVRRADEAYAGRAEHTPTRNGRRDPGLRLCGMRDHHQPHGAWLTCGNERANKRPLAGRLGEHTIAA